MLNARYGRMAHHLAYYQGMADMARDDEKKSFWEGACNAARQIIHSMQDEGEKYPFAYMKSDTEYFAVYRVHIGEYRAEVMIEK